MADLWLLTKTTWVDPSQPPRVTVAILSDEGTAKSDARDWVCKCFSVQEVAWPRGGLLLRGVFPSGVIRKATIQPLAVDDEDRDAVS